MLSCLFLLCFPLLTTNSFCSVSEQTLLESTVSTLSSTAENSTAELFQPKIVITLQDTQKMAVAKTVLYPCLLVLGTFGNVMTVAVHKRTVKTSPLSIFFIVLAMSDLLLLYSNCLPGWVRLVSHFDLKRYSNATCKLVIFLVYVSGVLSAWTLVAMTVQRAVSVLWPHRANVLCSAGKAKVSAVSMVLFITAIHGHILYGFSIVHHIGRQKECYASIRYDYFFLWNMELGR